MFRKATVQINRNANDLSEAHMQRTASTHTHTLGIFRQDCLLVFEKRAKNEHDASFQNKTR